MPCKRKYVAFAVLLLLSSLVLGGCFGSKETEAEPAVTSAALTGKVWRCTMLFERKVYGDSDITLEFLPDGKIKGNGGCNDYTGTYTMNGNKISFGPVASTKKSCGPSVDEQEFTYFSFLNRIDAMVVDGDELKLYAPEVLAPMEFTSGDGGGLFW